MIVVDANVAIAWVLTDDDDQRTRAAGVADLGRQGIEALIAPSVLTAEVAYVLLKRGRERRWSAPRIAEMGDVGGRIEVRLVETSLALPDLMRFALHHHVTAFDAHYLALAMSTGAKLATFDGGLQAAARKAGVVLA